MRNGQYMPDRRTEGARMPVPWLIGSDGWAVFFHQPFGKIDLALGQLNGQVDDIRQP